MTLLANLALVYACLMFIIFPFAYHIRTGGRWRDHPMGFHLMVFMGGQAAVLLVSTVWRFTTGEPIPDWLRLVMYLALGALVNWRTVLLYRYPHTTTAEERHLFRDAEGARD